MPKILSKPSYSFHKPSGQARCRIDGKDYYLGPYGSQKSRDEYDELIGEWLSKQEVSKVTLTVDHLCLLFLQHVDGGPKWRRGGSVAAVETGGAL
ncbi:MAG: hypothetical protein O2955_09565, partial [Planctomycetota bacterium]|nr:hypothetical protein [Planctomycetota bacterium]